MALRTIKTKQGTEVSNPPLARLLFDDVRLAPVWLIIRVLLGWAWIDASIHKLSSPAWMQTGEALKGFWAGALDKTSFVWYRQFLQGLLDSGSYVWFAKLVAIGEFTVGVALVLGAFIGVAAFMAGFMNWNFIMAGSASVNPLYFVAAIVLILAWKTAGYYGADRFLLPLLGTPWGRAKKTQAASSSAEEAVTA